MNLRPTLRLFLFGFFIVGPVWSATPPASEQAVVELPKFVVKDAQLLPPPESWRYTKIPGCEVLSNASAGDTQRFLKDFQMYQEVIDLVWPGLIEATSPVPTTLIIYGRGEGVSDFLNSKVRMVGNEAIEIEPLALAPGRPGRPLSRFFADGETACIVLDLNRPGDPYGQFHGEYMRYLLSRVDGQAPVWLIEGMARLFTTVDFTDKWINFNQVGPGGQRAGDFTTILYGGPPLVRAGRPVPGAPARPGPTGTPGLYALPRSVGLLRGTAFPSLAEMLQADARELLTNLKLRALAHEFVHMCLYGRGQQYQKGFFAYLERTKGSGASEAVFQECFGKSIGEMQDELQAYASFTDYQQIKFVAKKGHSLGNQPKPVLRDATQAEVGRIKGYGLMLAHKFDAARVALITPYVRGEHDPELLAALGIFEVRTRQVDRARKFLELAVAGHTARAGAGLELARLRHAELRTAATGPLNEKQREAVLAPLRAAAGLPPPLAGVYELMAKIWTESPDQPPAGDLAMLENGVRRFPGNLGLVYQTARLYSQAGLTQKAEGMVDWGQRASRDAADKERFALLRASLTVTTPPGVK